MVLFVSVWVYPVPSLDTHMSTKEYERVYIQSAFWHTHFFFFLLRMGFADRKNLIMHTYKHNKRTSFPIKNKMKSPIPIFFTKLIDKKKSVI